MLADIRGGEGGEGGAFRMCDVREVVLLQLQTAAPVFQLRLVALEIGKGRIASIRVQEMLLRLRDPEGNQREDSQMQKLQIVFVLEVQQRQEMGEGVPLQAACADL